MSQRLVPWLFQQLRAWRRRRRLRVYKQMLALLTEMFDMQEQILSSTPSFLEVLPGYKEACLEKLQLDDREGPVARVLKENVCE